LVVSSSSQLLTMTFLFAEPSGRYLLHYQPGQTPHEY
jgi:hypothetical protein